MKGSGCNKCPVDGWQCDAQYRGSRCAALRASKGADFDPKSNADRIRGMSDEELAAMMYSFEGLEMPDNYCQRKKACDDMLDSGTDIPDEKCIGCLIDWLRQPAKEEIK